ncbi:MAG: alpha/beta fold hydrolase [Bacteroidales bacterium]|nr:alpha/beta fold hydrolase [Bacteroidales bacterium]
MKAMRISLVTVVLLFYFSHISAQDTVYYKGTLNITDNQSLPLTLRIITSEDTNIIFMGSPLQTEQMIPATKTKFTADSVKFNISDMRVKVRLKYFNNRNELKGSFKQGLLNKDITFYKTETLFSFDRPQTPEPPFNYREKELTFKNPDSEYLFHGTLTYPENAGKYPVVVLVSGSGCQNRNEELYNHKPFMVIADYLTNNGIAVFRYDDRGYGSSDTDMYKGTTYDFAVDTRCAIEMLKQQEEIDTNNIFVLGHSEGGMICQILGAESQDLCGLILMAAPFVSGKEILLSQTEAILNLNNASHDYIQSALSEIENAKYDTNTINGLWLNYFYNFTPSKYVKKLKMPLLILQGNKDMQVISGLNMKSLEKQLPKKRKNVNIKQYENLNHLFQHCKTGNPDEYAEIEETISVEVLRDIKEFIMSSVKK